MKRFRKETKTSCDEEVVTIEEIYSITEYVNLNQRTPQDLPVALTGRNDIIGLVRVQACTLQY